MPPVQKLFETCKEVFAPGGTGFVPPPQDIHKLQSVLDGIKPEDVDLKPDMPYFRANASHRRPKITYLHIYECEKFSMGIFCLPPSGVIPLHNHPGMTVFSKLLFGTMHIKSYDWVVDLPPESPTIVKPSESQIPELRLAKVKVDADFTAPCNPSILYPEDGGNMHCFTAVTACAFLDVLGPPYNDAEGRHCTYYRNYPFSNFSDSLQSKNGVVAAIRRSGPFDFDWTMHIPRLNFVSNGPNHLIAATTTFFDVEGLSIPEEERNAYEWLQERDQLEDLKVEGKMYSGPTIVES